MNQQVRNYAKIGLNLSGNQAGGQIRMALIAVHAFYDGKDIHFLEEPPVSGSYRVVVMFLEPTDEVTSQDEFWASFGAWKDEKPIEATLKDIFDSRRSRTEPPRL
jgi:hypothetical protein